MDSVIGIDLSGLSRGTKGRTALAQLSVEDLPRLLDRHLLPHGQHTDVALLDWVQRRRPQLVAVDAPLTLPHGVTCNEPDCHRCSPPSLNYLTRDVDRMAGGMSMVMIAGIAFRGMYIARQFADRGLKVIEVYPAAAYQVWGLSRTERREPGRVDRLLRSKVRGEVGDTADERDAAAAALVAVDYIRGRAVGVTGEDGVIWVPASKRLVTAR